MVFYLDMHLGIFMKSLFGRLNLLLLLSFFYNKVVMLSRLLIKEIRANCQLVVTTMICDSVLSLAIKVSSNHFWNFFTYKNKEIRLTEFEFKALRTLNVLVSFEIFAFQLLC